MVKRIKTEYGFLRKMQRVSQANYKCEAVISTSAQAQAACHLS